MSLMKLCHYCSATLGRAIPTNAGNQTWNVYTVCKRTFFYKKKLSFDRGKAMQFLYDDHQIFSFKGLDRFFKKRDQQEIIKAQKYNQSMFESMGPDVWAANFVLTFKGKIKLKDDVVWLTNRSSLDHMTSMEIEGIDASNMTLFPVGLENIRYLEHLRYIKLADYVTDWYLFHLQTFSNSLEFVDISGCSKVTDAGIASLVSLGKLKGLDMTGCTSVKNPEILSIHLETQIPDLVIVGLDTLPKLDEKELHDELNKSRFLTIGEKVESQSQDHLTGKITLEDTDSATNECQVEEDSCDIHVHKTTT